MSNPAHRPASHMIRIAAILLLAAAAPWSAGCSSTTARQQGPSMGVSGDAAAEFLDELEAFVERLEDRVAAAALEMSRAAPTRERRERALLWADHVSRQCRRALAASDVRDAGASVWVVCVRLADYFESGEGSRLPPGMADAGRKASGEMQSAFETLARTRLDETAYAKIHDTIHEHARNNPAVGGILEMQLLEEDAPDLAGGSTVLDDVIGGVISPFKTFGTLNKGAEEVGNISKEVGRFNDILDGLPVRTRLQMQIFLADLERSTVMSDAVGGVTKMADGVDRVAKTAEELPARIRTEGEALVDRIENAQPQLRETVTAVREGLEETQATLAAFDASVEKTDRLTRDVSQGVQEVTETGRVWEGTAAAVRETLEVYERIAARDPDEPEAPPDENSFSFPRMTLTAQAATETAREFRALLDDADRLLAPQSLQERRQVLDDAATQFLARTDESARGVIDHATVRIAQLLGLAFLLAVGYRLLAGRMARGRTG